jgi:hypothetical protein
MSEAQQIHDKAFSPSNPRSPRSDAYKLGVLDALKFRFDSVPLKDLTRYPEASAEADAWYSGLEEGHSLWRKSQLTEIEE